MVISEQTSISYRYNIYIENCLTKLSESLNIAVKNNNIIIISQKNIFNLYKNKLFSILDKHNKNIIPVIISNGEKFKSLKSLEYIINILINNNCNKLTTIIALGGGMIGDLAGLAASIYMRGIKYIQIPTTLLAQIDSSIGGKTALNFNNVKNIIGTIYPAHATYIDLSLLKTLPDREYISGCAEMIKYAISLDYNFFCWLEENYKLILNKDIAALKFAIQKCCQLKSNLILQDINDTKGIRIKLNLGHTIAHAIEASSLFNKFLHGEAVAIGIQTESKIATKLLNLSLDSYTRINNILTNFNLPTKLNKGEIPLNELISKTMQDKKNLSSLRLVLPLEIGKLKTFNGINLQQFTKMVNEYAYA